MHGPDISRMTLRSASAHPRSTAKIEPARLGGDGTSTTRILKWCNLNTDSNCSAACRWLKIMATTSLPEAALAGVEESNSTSGTPIRLAPTSKAASAGRSRRLWPRDQTLSGCALQIAPDDEKGWHTVADEQLGKLCRLITVVIAPSFADNTGARPRSSGCAEFWASDAPESQSESTHSTHPLQ